MLCSKRDVDRHVEQLESKIHSESERNLKAFSVSKLYYNVGEYEAARRYLVRYLSVRENSAVAHKFHGQVLEALGQRERALASYKISYDLDQSQKDVVLKVCELLVASGEGNIDKSKARYWLELGERLFPRHKNVTELRSVLSGGLNGKGGGGGSSSGGASAEASPEQQSQGLQGSGVANLSSMGNHEDSLLWSASGSVLNGSRREAAASRHDTPVKGSMSLLTDRDGGPSSTPRRFVPRPSPERLAAQIEGLEATQERVSEMLSSQNRQLVEEFRRHSASVTDELRCHRQSALEEMKTQRQNVTDLKMEMKQGMHDIKVEIAKLGMVLKEAAAASNNAAVAAAAAASATATTPAAPAKAAVDPAYHQELKDALASLPKRLAAALPPPPHPQPVSAAVAGGGGGGAKGLLTLAEMQEALAQQTALLQMGGFGFAAGMFARPPLPPAPHGAPGPPGPPGPVLPAQPLPPHAVTPGPWNPPPPAAAAAAAVSGQPPLPPQQPQAPEVASKAPAEVPKPTAPPPANIIPGSPKLHEFQINLPKVPPMTPPFKDDERPAVPIVTSALLSNIPSPAYSSLAKTPPSSKPSSATAATASAPPPPPPTTTTTTSTVETSLFDKFKPRAGSWECGGCMVRNDESVICCPSCETAKPGHEEEVKKQKEAARPTVTFGAGGGLNFGFGSGGGGGGGFRFGVPKDDQSGVVAEATVPAEDGHLSFEGKGMKLNSKADAEPVAKTISDFKNMRKLTFSGNTVGIDAAEVIGQSLAKHPEFEEALWKDMFTGRMKTEIPPALKHLSAGILKAQAKLSVLDLSDNAFGPIGMEGIVDLLKSPCCYGLKELKLNNTGCGIAGGTKLAETLMETYQSSSKAGRPLALRVFILGRSRQENDGAKALAKVFKAMGSLEEVIMPQNGIYHEGIQALADAFAHNRNLKTLNMNDNTFTERGARYMANALDKLQKLTYLNLGDCLLKTEGAKLIASALEMGHEQLEELHMDSNEIRLEGGEAIVDAVKGKPAMKVLHIGTNNFGEEGCQKLLERLGDRMSLLPEGEIEDDEGDEPSSEEESESEEEEEEEVRQGAAEEEKKKEEGKGDTEKKSPFAGFSFGGAGSSIFGSSPASGSGSIFGNAAKEGKDGSSSIFGTPAASTSIFGTPKGEESASIFGTPKGEGSSIFGGAAKDAGGSSGSGGVDLSESSKGFSSFSSLATKGQEGGFAFAKSDSGKPFSFAGAGSSLFKPSPTKQEGHNEDDSAHVEDDGHDPHFEPVVPLPELVKVTTGEEDEKVLFQHRAKVFRYDKDTKQWKERGIGDMKILKHPQKNTFRVLLRREQIHKIACNHLITTDMELKPMMTTETAVTWFAMDYADEEPKLENLAVRFKLVDTLNDFKKVFEDCQAQLRNKSTPTKTTDAPTTNGPKAPSRETKSEVSSTTRTPEKKEEKKEGAESSSSSSSFFGTPSNVASFSSLAAGAEGFAFGKVPTDSPFSFSGAGASVFKASPGKDQQQHHQAGEQKHDDSGAGDDDGHDPHFEPIIALPELVAVTTGEEDEEVLFKHRAKVFRFDPDSKQWKERGVGDIKILKHPTKNTYRVLLRRDQIHKIACNHLISTEMELKPMFGTETALCWFAMDHADEEAKLENLAVRFKLEETKNDFRKVFEECQEALRTAPAGSAGGGPAATSTTSGSGVETIVARPAEGEDSQDESGGEEDEEEENIMYERECTLHEVPKSGGAATSLGDVVLKIVYDDDVYGARIVAHSVDENEDDEGEEEEEGMVCNHLIAMQTTLETDGGYAWSALDFSHDPPAYRQFRATFKTPDDEQEFKDAFYEGKELADQSEILELPQDANPESYYYGEGGDYEEGEDRRGS